MRIIIWLLAASWAVPALSQNADQVQQLQQELQQERQHIKQLEERLSAIEAARRPGTAAPAGASTADPHAIQASFGPTGFTLQSADGANAIHFRGNLSLDGRFYSDAYSPTSADTWLIRRLRPTLEGTLARYFDFRLMPDFAQGKTLLQDGWADARITPWLTLQFGKFKAPVGLERLQLEQFARFIETGLTADLLPYRDLGARLGTSVAQGALTAEVGMFDGAADGGSTDTNTVPDQNSTGKFTWDGRLFARPFLHTDWTALRGLGFGVAATYVNDEGIATSTTTTSLLAAYKTPGQLAMFSYRGNTGNGFNNATIAHGIERRLVPQFYYYYRSFGLLGEYVDEQQQVSRRLSATAARFDTLENRAWQVQAYWFVTGEDEGYDTATPRSDFRFGDGGLGAWELVARYHEICFDPAAFAGGTASFANPLTAPRAARALGAGINWYLNRNFKLQLDYDITRFDGGAANGDRPDEHVLISQFALIF